MFEPKKSVPQRDRRLLQAPRFQNSADPRHDPPREPQQRRMMVIALVLLIVALGFVLFRDRDFWFPDAQDAMDADAPATPTVAADRPVQSGVAKATSPVVASKRTHAVVPQQARHAGSVAASDPPPAAIQRTVLPPLEVEVVAGDAHRTVRPGSNSVRVDLQPGSSQSGSSQSSPSQSSPSQPSSSQIEIADAPEASAAPATAANLTKASERVEVSADASQIVSRSVRPGYPMLARQMKVQGSVILQALISRDGAIQDLHVMSGPPILAGAAREAVKQWHFKPHYLGAEAVETQAKITVNFTISTN
jgi:protein TonB